MADDWKPGDKGVCLTDGPWYEQFLFILIATDEGPKRGDIVTVGCVHPSRREDIKTPYLGLREHPHQHYNAINFRKLPPSSEKHVEALKTSIKTKEPTRV